MLNFAEQTGSGAVIVVWSFLETSQISHTTKVNPSLPKQRRWASFFQGDVCAFTLSSRMAWDRAVMCSALGAGEQARDYWHLARATNNNTMPWSSTKSTACVSRQYGCLPNNINERFYAIGCPVIPILMFFHDIVLGKERHKSTTTNCQDLQMTLQRHK
jgi:hypothetical protein